MGGGVKHSTFLLIAIGVVLGHSPVASQQTNSPVTLMLRIAGDRNQFRPGEIIPIELEFRSSIPGRFVLDNATYDRSGRLRLDDYRIEPNDQVTDPMLDYFAASPGFVGGGVRGMPILDRTPVVVEQALNHFFRFDQPGHY